MDRRTGKSILKTGRKTVMISFRCTEDLKKKIEVKAGHFGIGESKFISDCVEVGLKKRSRYDKGKASSLVVMQEAMNRMVMELGDNQDDMKTQMLEFMERTTKLWEF